MLFFFEIIRLLVEETSRYYHQYLDTLDGQSTLPGMTVQEICLFLAIIVQMGHDQMETLEDYWLTLEQYFMAVYGNSMKQDRFYHIFTFLHLMTITVNLPRQMRITTDCEK
jgi:hypothetical protein